MNRRWYRIVIVLSLICALAGARRAQAHDWYSLSYDLPAFGKLLQDEPNLARQRNPQTGVTTLHEMAQWNSPAAVKMLIAAGAPLNAQDNEGKTALHWAVRWNKPDNVRVLLENGANANLRDKRGRTPLREAMVMGYDDSARLLIERKAEVDVITAAGLGLPWPAPLTRAQTQQRDDLGRTPLHWAAARGHVAPMRELLATGADIDARDTMDNAPLLLAVGYPDAMRLLLERGARVDASNALGKTALHDAAERFYPSPIKMLLDHKANATLPMADGSTVLHMLGPGSRDETLRVFKLLVENKAPLMARDGAGNTALHRAVMRNNGPLADLLLEAGVDANAVNSRGDTALHTAVRPGLEPFVGKLLAARALPNARNLAGRAPLHEAVAQGLQPVVETLLIGGADVAMLDGAGVSALDLALTAGHDKAFGFDGYPAIAALLLKAGARPGIFHAAYFGQEATVAALLRANPKLANTHIGGVTPLHLAAAHGSRAVAELLVANGADIDGGVSAKANGARRYGATPLHLASEAGHVEMVEFLLDKGADPKVIAPNTYGANAVALARMKRRTDVVQLFAQRKIPQEPA